MKREEKISTGLNDRPRNEPIGQTGVGLPDDTSRPVEVSDDAIARTREKLGLAPEEAEDGRPGPNEPLSRNTGAARNS